MFIGHFGLSFAARPAAPRTGLTALFAAAAFADVLWPVLVALGIEQVRIDPGNTAVTPLDFVSYARSTRPRDKTGTWAFVGLIAFLAVSYAANLLGGPPPSVTR